MKATIKSIMKGVIIIVLFTITILGLAADTYWLLWLAWAFMIMPIYEASSRLIDRI